MAPVLHNEPQQIELRKQEDTLRTVGGGILLMSLWTLGRTFVLLYINRNDIVNLVLHAIGAEGAGLSRDAVYAAAVIIIGILTGMISLLYIYVGMCAVAEGRGKRRGVVYIVLALLMVLGRVPDLFMFSMEEESAQLYTLLGEGLSLSSYLINLTAIIMLAQMVYSAFRVRRLSKALARKEG